MPDRLTRPAPAPALDTQCRFPWRGVAGCAGKDARSMLELTISDDLENRARLSAVPGWFENVRKSYGAR